MYTCIHIYIYIYVCMHAICGIYMYIHVYVCIHTPSISCGAERQVEVLHSLIDQVAHGMFGVVKIIMKSPVFVKCRAAVFRKSRRFMGLPSGND